METKGNASIEINNSAFIEELFDLYKSDPQSVSPSWRHYFKQIESSTPLQVPPSTPSLALDEARIANLIETYRMDGHLRASINPIALKNPEEPSSLKLSSLGFHENELNKPFPTFGLLQQKQAPLSEIIQFLKNTYCHHFSVELNGLRNSELKEWIQNEIESRDSQHLLPDSLKIQILQQLSEAELFESFLHTKYVGQKRFSLEGGETLIPMLTAIIDAASESSIEEIVLGMAHRGRLNVLAQIVRKPYTEIFNEFDEDYISESFEGSGDVKYHKGYISESFLSHSNKKIKVTLAPNPSHLEFVDPVVEGFTRAKQTDRLLKPNVDKALPILIHGDAALSGQGVIYETLQLTSLEGYSTGGTIHLVINNQIGFTTLPKDSRSTLYCTDIARTFDAPVFHVNAEDPEICIWATLLAFRIREKFHCDVFVDLNGYRKYGHNEGDEPAFTQPLEYQLIKKMSSISTLYQSQLIQEGVVTQERIANEQEKIKKSLQEVYEKVQKSKKPSYTDLMTIPDQKTLFSPVATAVPEKTIQELTRLFCSVPPSFQLHPKLENLLKERINMAEGKKPFDWGMGEMLAYATLLWEGFPIRLAGQDSCRGTFSHRHAMWIDQKKEQAYFSLSHLKEGQGRFEVINSLLSETAALGFEYGYSLAIKQGLTIWEAQFGDFSNSAQVIIDQFIASGEQKWGQKSSLTLLLPHGYEGQGPEHSSGRLERFLALAGHDNIQVVYPTTPAQLFHLLRRQVIGSMIKPLIVFTPKGLLRHPACTSALSDFSQGHFQDIIDDLSDPSNTRRLVFCTGRHYYDLLQERNQRSITDIALIRIEQLYPLDKEQLKKIISRYKGYKECIWSQEEPKNMGAWHYIRSYLEEILPKEIALKYNGREISASPATGSHLRHNQEHKMIMNGVYNDKRN